MVSQAAAAANPVDGGINPPSSKKKTGKVPRKIHKAEREKMKRDHMNDLFLDLEKALGLEQPNNGKASILRETVRLLGELISQVESLKKENVALISESNYVTSEKNELVEETCALDDQIKRLQREIVEKSNCSNTDILQPMSNDSHLASHASEPTPVLAPLFIMPLHHESDGFPEVDKPKSNITKPRPRYPSSSDIWPSHILTKQTTAPEDV